MKKLSSPFARLLAVAGCALALGSCNRADYAMLPKASTYYGEAPHRHVVAAPAADQQAAALVAAPAPAVAAAPAVVAAPMVPQTPKTATLAAQAETATTVTAAPAAKPTLVQRMLAKKLMKNLNRMAVKVQHKDATASTARLDGNLRTGIIFLLVAVIASLFSGLGSGVGTIFGVIAVIFAILGLVFLVLWLLDQV